MTPPPRNRRRPHPANRRRQRPSSTHTAARRHSRWLAQQLQRAGTWLRGLPTRLRSSADTAVSGRLLRPWGLPEPITLSPDPKRTADALLDSTELVLDPNTGTTTPRNAVRPATPRDVVITPRDTHDHPTNPGTPRDTHDRPTNPGPPRDAARPTDPGTSHDAARPTSTRPATLPGTRPATLLTSREPEAPARRTAPYTTVRTTTDISGDIPPPARLHPDLRPARPLQRASEFSKHIAPRALALGRELAPRAADLGRRFGRQLGPMAARGAAATGRGLLSTGRRLADLRPLLRLLGRGFAAIGGLTVHLLGALARGSTITGDRIAGALQRHRVVLLALFTRALWWTALALLFLGGQALVEIHERAPFVAAALPVFLTGLALCAFLLLFARHARMRWAAFALGLGHGGLLALVWVVSAIA